MEQLHARPRPPRAPRPRCPRRGLAIGTIVISIAVLALLAGGVLVFINDSPGEVESGRRELFSARIGGFDITVPASGELAALKQTEIVNKLETRATITEIIEEGTSVRKGDVLLRINDEEVRQRVDDARDTVNTARNALVTAQSNLEIKRHANASEIAKADLTIELARLALRAWEDGEVVSMRQSLALERETAEKDYERLAARFEASVDLLAREFISKDEFQQDEIRMIQARSRLDQARLAIEVYENFTYKQDRAKFESDLKQAIDERERIGQRHANDITRLESDVASKEYQLQSAEDRLVKHEAQLEHCIVKAPQDGLVVYWASLSGRGGRGGSDEVPQVGTELRRNETVMILPDTSRMVAEVKVNEALSGKIAKGQRATVVSDAVPDRTLEGEVLSVGVLAESGGWRDPNRRDYTVKIALKDTVGLGLKPSMRCKATILVDNVREALHIPIQAVFRKGRASFVYVPDGRGYSQREVALGRSSELYIEINDGLSAGDRVLLHEPSSERIESQVQMASAVEGENDEPRGPRPERSRVARRDAGDATAGNTRAGDSGAGGSGTGE